MLRIVSESAVVAAGDSSPYIAMTRLATHTYVSAWPPAKMRFFVDGRRAESGLEHSERAWSVLG
jgi:hypothetical protein